ncbi:MAG: DUF1598 domain-containing protein [Planctomycetaceae bacterium]
MTSTPRSSYRIRRTGSTVTASLVTVAGLAVVFGAIAWMSNGPADSRNGLANTATPTAQPSIEDAPETKRSEPNRLAIAAADPSAEIVVLDADSPATKQEEVEVAAAPVVPVSATRTAPMTRRDRVAAHLAAGEFGPAMDLASESAGVDERRALSDMIATAQRAIGEGGSAFAALRRVPLPEPAADSPRVSRSTLAGGGGADFTELIDLIENETSGPWIGPDGVGGSVTQNTTGVRVDPNGLLQLLTREERTERLKALGVQARTADLNEDMARPSELRLVSLTRLEREVARRVAAGQPVVETMRHLAGLSRIEYVFVYPEQNEIVIGGPAEGWRYDEQGVAVGTSTSRPMAQLDDLVTVLRVFAPQGEKIFQCSIVPRQEHMRLTQEFVAQSQARGSLAPAGVARFAQRIERIMGEQDVEFIGLPLDSRVAQVTLEADYRMKLIGIGKLDGGPRIKGFFDLLTGADAKNPPPTNAMRWWLTMKYDAVRHSADRDVFEIKGSSVLCQSEDEFVTARGERVSTGRTDGANRAFAAGFTEHYAALAEKDPVFADLQNIFDLSLVAALVQREKLHDRAGWDLGCFALDGEYQPASHPVPKTVPSVVNHRVYNGRDVVVQAAGGVRGDLLAVVDDKEVRQAAPQLGGLVPQAKAPELPAGRWWWDAATAGE